MNLIFRLFWMFLTARFRSGCQLLEESALTFRVLSTDLDVNMHLTNSRYFSFMDLSRVDHMIRCGAWAHIRAEKLMPVLGSATIRYRRSLSPFTQFDVTTRTVGSDDRWIYLEHKILVEEEIYAIAVMKAAFLDKNGRVPTARLLEIFGYEGEPPPLTSALTLIRDLDQALTDISANKTGAEATAA